MRSTRGISTYSKKKKQFCIFAIHRYGINVWRRKSHCYKQAWSLRLLPEEIIPTNNSFHYLTFYGTIKKRSDFVKI